VFGGRLPPATARSIAVSILVLTDMTEPLDLVQKPAIAIDHEGRVLELNAAAKDLIGFDLSIVSDKLVLKDPSSQATLDKILGQMDFRLAPAGAPFGPVIISRSFGLPIVIRVWPTPKAGRLSRIGACALLIITDLAAQPSINTTDLARVFGLTGAESRLAARLANGSTLNEVAEELGIARETARNQLKAVFAKTGTHRQSELVALLMKL
jgi:DNA-binding CsgD family transcriptional regulator